jgi:hypothetical protein
VLQHFLSKVGHSLLGLWREQWFVLGLQNALNILTEPLGNTRRPNFGPRKIQKWSDDPHPLIGNGGILRVKLCRQESTQSLDAAVFHYPMGYQFRLIRHGCR